MRIIVTCAFGLEAVVKRELIDLGYGDFAVLDGRIEFDGSIEDIPRLNINLRVADRVLLKVGEFDAVTFTELFDGTRELNWEDWIPPDGRILVNGKSVRSQLASIRSCQAIVNKAIVERLKDKHSVQVLPETGSQFTVQISMLRDKALLTLDTTGPGLHKRGYRESRGEVPLRENLAAALVLLSFWKRDRLLIDPLCGSGTILIEAAMIGRNIAPGLKRSFLSEGWPALNKSLWTRARQEARDAIIREGAPLDGPVNIHGYDMEPERIEDCRKNAARAGVAEDISFQVRELKDLWIDKQYGIMITNPPYGHKLGEFPDINRLYVTLHHMLKKKKGWSLFVITADRKFPDYFKRSRPDKVRKLFNGALEVNYYQYYGEKPRPV